MLPSVLSTRIRKSAKTCSGVLYSCFAPRLPHCGRSAVSCRRESSARNIAVGMSLAHEVGNSVVNHQDWPLEHCWDPPRFLPLATASCIVRSGLLMSSQAVHSPSIN